MEKDLDEAITRNADLASIVKFYQVNLSRISKSSIKSNRCDI